MIWLCLALEHFAFEMHLKLLATKRRHETLVAAARIHGGSENNPKPALDGMFDTLNKRCKLNTMKDYVVSNDKLKDRVVSNVYRGNVRSFENSPTNVKRSIGTFYGSGVMGKRKYQAVRVALSLSLSDVASSSYMSAQKAYPA